FCISPTRSNLPRDNGEFSSVKDTCRHLIRCPSRSLWRPFETSPIPIPQGRRQCPAGSINTRLLPSFAFYLFDSLRKKKGRCGSSNLQPRPVSECFRRTLVSGVSVSLDLGFRDFGASIRLLGWTHESADHLIVLNTPHLLCNIEEDGHKVSLHVYDLSQGLARQLSSSFLGKVIDGIWHTGIVVYGNEYYFGGGIQHASVGTTPYGTPIRVVDLGVTHVPKELFEEYLGEIGPRYTAETYTLLEHNCNNFSNEVAQFLVGATIPEYILQLPNEVKSSPMGALILPMIQQLETTLRAGAVPQPPQFRQSPPSSRNIPSGFARTQRTSSMTPNVQAADPSRSADATPAPNAKKHSEAKAPNGSGNAVESPEGSISKAGADSLGDARSRVQEEITKEFASLMASGTLRASEAAALATRRVMQRYGALNVSAQ
ncbi:hypothetical protein Taro_003995, partial [Colocasia esculenta]|nr:hypothetical protein [Colocasia esculenta]